MMLEQEKLLSAVGVDYAPLHGLLASGQWKKADEETGVLMLKISRRVTAGWLREEDIETFPCADLLSIDQLWVKHTSDRFGFSVQCRIWESVREDYGKFSDAVRWRSHDWLQYPKLTFNLNAPVGHLPAAPFFKLNELAVGWTASLPTKLADCCDDDF